VRVLHLEHDKYTEEALNKLKQYFILETLSCQSQDEFYKHLQQNKYEVIFTRLGLMINEQVFDLQPDLKFIVTPTTGLNHIDLGEASKRNVILISLKGETEFLASIKSTAEHTWMLLLSLIRNLRAAINSVIIAKEWDRVPYLADELNGKTIGIIGFGRLGKIICKYAQAFDMNIMANDILSVHSQDFPNVNFCNLETLLSSSDFVLLMISWNEENEQFMNQEKFNLMKKGSWFINTSRGELVDENALLEQLTSGKLKGAALDVLDNDSAWDGKIKGSFGLINYAANNHNLIITPHTGGYGKGSIEKTRNFITKKFINYLSAQHETNNNS